jgi:hypothetical protein
VHKTPEVAAASNPRLPILGLMVGSVHAQLNSTLATLPREGGNGARDGYHDGRTGQVVSEGDGMHDGRDVEHGAR